MLYILGVLFVIDHCCDEWILNNDFLKQSSLWTASFFNVVSCYYCCYYYFYYCHYYSYNYYCYHNYNYYCYYLKWIWFDFSKLIHTCVSFCSWHGMCLQDLRLQVLSREAILFTFFLQNLCLLFEGTCFKCVSLLLFFHKQVLKS